MKLHLSLRKRHFQLSKQYTTSKLLSSKKHVGTSNQNKQPLSDALTKPYVVYNNNKQAKYILWI